MNNYYIYFWSVPEYGIFYVGQGKHNNKRRYDRAFNYHYKQSYLQKFLSTITSDEINVTILSDNIPLELPVDKHLIEYEGVVYTKKELAEEYGLTIENLDRRLKQHIPLDQKIIKKIKLKIDGVIYNSLSEARRLTGLTVKYIYYWYKRGKFEP